MLQTEISLYHPPDVLLSELFKNDSVHDFTSVCFWFGIFSQRWIRTLAGSNDHAWSLILFFKEEKKRHFLWQLRTEMVAGGMLKVIVNNDN